MTTPLDLAFVRANSFVDELREGGEPHDIIRLADRTVTDLCDIIEQLAEALKDIAEGVDRLFEGGGPDPRELQAIARAALSLVRLPQKEQR